MKLLIQGIQLRKLGHAAYGFAEIPILPIEEKEYIHIHSIRRI